MSADTTALREVGPELATHLTHLWVGTFSRACADECSLEDIRT